MTIATCPCATMRLPMMRAVVEGILAAENWMRSCIPRRRRPTLVAQLAPSLEANSAATLPISPAFRSDRARGLYDGRLAGGDLVLRPGLQRAEATRTRLQLRTGNACDDCL